MNIIHSLFKELFQDIFQKIEWFLPKWKHMLEYWRILTDFLSQQNLNEINQVEYKLRKVSFELQKMNPFKVYETHC